MPGMGLSLGLGLAFSRPAASEGGGEAYLVDAVHINGNTGTLFTNSLTSTDSPKLTASFWFKLSADGQAPFFVNDPDNSLSILIYATVSAGEIVAFEVTVEDVNANDQFILSASVVPSAGEWHHALISLDTDFEAEQKQGKIYIDDVDVTSIDSDTDDAFSMVSNGRPALIGYDQGDVLICDLAEYFIAPSLSLLSAGDIPEASRRFFIDENGKPVDLAGAVAEFGTPRILLSGDAAAFVTNQGSGGALSLAEKRRSDEIPAPGPTSIGLPGAVAGKTVASVLVGGEDVSDDFEATISVNDQIQQTGTMDFFTSRCHVTLTPGAITDADSSPSD